MNHNAFGIAVVGMALFGAGGVGALAAEDHDLGQQEYYANCADCHGLSGKGNGPLKPYIAGTPSDLTLLERNNSGVFPFARVYEVIDGRKSPGRHGSSDMLIWGNEFRQRAIASSWDIPDDPEVYVRARILALTEYVNRLQGK